MRKQFSAYIEDLARKDDSVIFVTGDLGYNAFENLQEVMGERFINAGVAEQNMVGIASGMASQGFKVFCYSIAPFIVYRCLEQVRNDVCFHNLPVYLVGNGGGYGYGIMGSSHHAIEDLATLAGLPNMQCYVPSYLDDLYDNLNQMVDRMGPSYLRLGLGKDKPVNTGTNMVFQHNVPDCTVFVQGPVVVEVEQAIQDLESEDNIDLITVNHLPLLGFPSEWSRSAMSSRKVLVVEEHIAHGGLGEALSLYFLKNNFELKRFSHLKAEGYPSGSYGSQSFHKEESGLDATNIKHHLEQLLN